MKESDHHHGGTHKQPAVNRVQNAHHASKPAGFPYKGHALDQAHHSTGHEGFFDQEATEDEHK